MCMPEKAMAPHSSTLAWKIPWTEQPAGLQFMGSLRIGHDWATSLSLFTFMHWRRKWQPTPVFLPGESQGWGSLVGWGRTGRTRLKWLSICVCIGLAKMFVRSWKNPNQHFGQPIMCVCVCVCVRAHVQSLSRGLPFATLWTWNWDWIRVSSLAGGFFTTEPPGEPTYVHILGNVAVISPPWWWAKLISILKALRGSTW